MRRIAARAFQLGIVVVYSTVANYWRPMSLNDKEREILEEIERRFNEDDPRFIATVRNISKRGGEAAPVLLYVMFALGVGILLLTFSKWPSLGLVGFLLMVFSTTQLIRKRRPDGTQPTVSVEDVQRGSDRI